VHDILLIITPLQGGEFAVFLSAQGLLSGGSYLVEGITSGTHKSILPLASTAADSGFVADSQGNGIYSHVFVVDPRTEFGVVLLLYLPNNQMEGSVLLASATLG
jgi:hypothetical protein